MRTALTFLFALVCSIAVAHTDGIYNPTANSVGDTQGIDSNAASGGGGALACSYTPVTTGTQNVSYTGATPAASGGVPAYTFSETGALPTGLTINSGTGVISGTPSVNGSFPGIQVKVTDSALTVANCSTAFTLTIAAPAFQGPGDLSFSTPLPYFSVRAYSAATRGSNLLNVCDPANVTCADWKSDAVTGNLVATTNPLNGTDCTVSTTCTIKTWYDISGASLCAGALPCNLTQATAASRATLLFNCNNGKPCGVFVRASTQTYGSTGVVSPIVQPITLTSVAIRTGTLTSNQGMGAFQNGSSNLQFTFSTTPKAGLFAGTATILSGTAADNSWHSFQALASGASSVVTADGVDGAASNAGAAGWTLSIFLGQDGFANDLDGKLSEFGGFGSAINRVTLCHNQFTYFGTATSC